jgi:hypothetical protein
MIDGPNMYQYVKVNPVAMRDPTGRFTLGSGVPPKSTWRPFSDFYENIGDAELHAERGVFLAFLRILSRPACALAFSKAVPPNTCSAPPQSRGPAAFELSAHSVIWGLDNAARRRAGLRYADGESAHPLGDRPYQIALDAMIVSGETSKQDTASIIIHEWAHHWLRVSHPPSATSGTASDLVYDVQRSCE